MKALGISIVVFIVIAVIAHLWSPVIQNVLRILHTFII